jgi:uncharacterized cupredoxin-like copper-binding protein
MTWEDKLMVHDRLHQMLDTRLTRRAAIQTAGAVGAAGMLASRGLHLASAQGTATDPFEFPDLTITAVEYAFEMPTTAEAGWTHVIMDNQGMMDHHAMFLRPNDGATIEDVQVALESGDLGALFAVAASAGGPNVGPGNQASVAMNLEAGQYLVICAIPNEEGIPHFALGMQAVLDVTEGAAVATAPAADATVNLVEMTFDGLPANTTAGTHVWEVANTGTQLHEMVILQLAAGLTIDQALQLFNEPPPSASPVATPVVDQAMATPVMEPPFEAIGGVAPMTPGETNYAVLDLAAGDYIAICFVPDAETGMPHFAMGMIAGFTVS